MIILNISIGIIITLICIEIYYSYFYKESVSENENMDNDDDTESENLEIYNGLANENDEVIEFKEPNPWCKIIVGLDNTTRYFVKINNFNEDKYLEWRKLINSLDYDVETRELILETNSEEEALALTNLIISNMNDEIEIEDILDKNLIHISVAKAKSHKLVCNKLIELIKDSSSIDIKASRNANNQVEYSIDMNRHIETKQDLLNDVNKKIFSNEPMNNTFMPIAPTPYGGSEYALL
ncbi:MAG: hypothetical protein HN930_02835 [Pelagibacterales bacterium]|nr:hypothetical protein [Pelagibacterales bacterium]